HDPVEERYEDKARQEDAERRQQRAAQPGDQEADEGRYREDGTRGRLADRDGVEQLTVGQPVIVLDNVGVEECVKHVATAEADRAELEKGEKDAEERRTAEQRRRDDDGHATWSRPGRK